MISSQHLYDILSKIVPLYVVMILAYSKVKWWKIFTANDCLKINKFVVLFAVPFFSANFIAENNPYTMNYNLIAADAIQKAIIYNFIFIFMVKNQFKIKSWMVYNIIFNVYVNKWSYYGDFYVRRNVWRNSFGEYDGTT